MIILMSEHMLIYNDGYGHVCTTNTYRSAHEQMKMTECAAYSTHQPQHTADVYEPVTTTT